MKRFAPDLAKATPFWRSLTKRLQNAQPQKKFCVKKGLVGAALNKRFAMWLSTRNACYNMFDPQNGIATVVLFNGSNLSYNGRVIGLTGHCLS